MDGRVKTTAWRGNRLGFEHEPLDVVGSRKVTWQASPNGSSETLTTLFQVPTDVKPGQTIHVVIYVTDNEHRRSRTFNV
jgi:hypothetical protein